MAAIYRRNVSGHSDRGVSSVNSTRSRNVGSNGTHAVGKRISVPNKIGKLLNYESFRNMMLEVSEDFMGQYHRLLSRAGNISSARLVSHYDTYVWKVLLTVPLHKMSAIADIQHEFNCMHLQDVKWPTDWIMNCNLAGTPTSMSATFTIPVIPTAKFTVVDYGTDNMRLVKRSMFID